MRKPLQGWIDDNLQFVNATRWCDVHIDVIDKAFKARELWIDGALQLFQEGVSYIEQKNTNFILSICFALRSLSYPLGVNFATVGELEKELYVTPPSLYMFLRNYEPWREPQSGFSPIALNLGHHMTIQVALLYLEYKEKNEVEYRRSLWIVAPPDPPREVEP